MFSHYIYLRIPISVETTMKITLNNEGLLVNGSKVEFPCALNELLEVFGPHDRKVFGTQNIHIYEERGIYFYNNSNDKTSDGIFMSFRKDLGFQPEKAFSGTICIGGEEFDMSDLSNLEKLENLFTFHPGENRADLKMGEYRIFIYKKEGLLISVGFHKMEALELPKAKVLNYDNKVHLTPKAAFDIEVVEQDCNNGWSFGNPKGITSVQWPRAHNNGIPMSHLFTVKVPEDYRVHGQEFMAVSLFYSELDKYDADIESFITGQLQEMPQDEHAAFWEALDVYRKNKHPKSYNISGDFGEEYTVVWLTQAEFEGETTKLPENNLAYELPDMQYTVMVYNEKQETREFLQLVERENDPNAGKMPTDDDDDPDYIPMYSDKGEELGLERFWGKQHFGGTSSPCQMEPTGFTPFYLEFDESLGNANFGGDGVAQLDLLKNELKWQCG